MIPPIKGVPSPDGIVASNGYTFESLGMRVPTVVISPWVEKGTVVHQPQDGPTPTSQYEGASSIATANKLFDIPVYLTQRHKWAATFDWLFTLRDTPRDDCPTTLPALPPVPQSEIDAQKRKPLNDHMAIQVEFYCKENDLDSCPDVTSINQGQASTFILEQVEIFMHKLKSKIHQF